MPHSFSENKILKKGSPTTKLELKSLVLIKETFVDWVYLIGGVTFVIGSIFFLPKMETYGDTGAWIFIFGSLMYLAVTGYELTMSIKLIRKNKVNTVWAHLEFSSTLIYLIGAASYLFASILFLSEINQVFEGAISFIIGSLLFLVGASINVIEITNASSTESLQLMNGAAIMYISGSLLFLVASIPYVWHGIDIHEQSIIYSYVAIEYIAGSVLFTFGGVFSMIKTFKEKGDLIIK